MEIECVKLKGLYILARQTFNFFKINQDCVLSVLCQYNSELRNAKVLGDFSGFAFLFCFFWGFFWPEATNSSLRIHLQQSNLLRQQEVVKSNQIRSCEGLLVSICTLHLTFFLFCNICHAFWLCFKEVFLETQYCWVLYQKYC